MYPFPDAQRQQDEEHLKLVSIGFYIYGGLLALFSLFPLIHVSIGLMMILNPPPAPAHGSGPPFWFGWVFVGVGGAVILIGETLAVLTLFAGAMVQRRRQRMFVIVMAALACANMPLGTALGVLSLLVLMRESVRARFEEAVT